MKKSLIILSIILSLVIMLVACGAQNPSSNTAGQSDISSTETSSVLTDTSSDVSSEDSASSSEINSPVSSAVSSTPQATSNTAPKQRSTFYHFSVVLPDGYIHQEASGIHIIYNPQYPTHGDNINFTTAPADDSSLYTKSMLDSVFSSMFENYSGITSIDHTTLDGLPFVVFSYSYTLNGIKMDAKQGMIFGSTYTDVITMTQLSTTFDAEFNAIFQSLKVVK